MCKTKGDLHLKYSIKSRIQSASGHFISRTIYLYKNLKTYLYSKPKHRGYYRFYTEEEQRYGLYI